MFSHITVKTSNLVKAGRSFNGILLPLGYIQDEVPMAVLSYVAV